VALRRAFLAVAAATVAGCEPGTIRIVGPGGGVYMPGQGCTTMAEAPSCPGPSDPLPQLRFESLANPGVTPDLGPGNLSAVTVSCRHSYCGTGSLAAHAELVWANDDRNYPQRMASFTHVFDPPVDLYGKTIGFYVRIDGPPVPMHAQIGVIYQYWRWVGWAPVPVGSGEWLWIGGVVSPDNPLTEIDAAVTAIPVTEVRLDVYVPVAGASGSDGQWTGDIYIDDLGWR
jgi:hypothetical protein